MQRHRKTWAIIAGLALIGGGQTVLATPAAATPAGAGAAATDVPVAAGPSTSAAASWEKPVPGASAEIAFADADQSARAAALSPHLTWIMEEAQRVRTVEIDAGAVTRSLTAESVSIELFDDTSVDLETTVAPSTGAATRERASTVYSASGADSAAVVTVVDGDLHGSFWQGATRYGIEPLGGGRHLVFEDGRAFPDEASPLADDAPGDSAPSSGNPSGPSAPAEAPAAAPGAASASAPSGPGTLSTTVIDVMVAYDLSAEAQFGSIAATEAEILAMINVTNMVFDNSDNDVQVSLTNILDLDYQPNSSDGTTDDSVYLAAIRSKTDGIVDEIHPARDANSADLVAVISDLTGMCGRAYLPGGANSAEERAFSLTDGACAVGNLTFPHELGHNLCAHHDPANVGANPCESGFGIFDGYGHVGPAENLRTVMSYANSANDCLGCTRIPYFSNPDITYDGWTTGVLGERDNSRVVEEMKDFVADYRTPGVTPCMVDYTIASVWSGNVQVELTVENTTQSWINDWTVEWTFFGDENVYNSWGVDITQVGQEVTGTGDGFGASIPPEDDVTVGFQATVSGTPTVPGDVTCHV